MAVELGPETRTGIAQGVPAGQQRVVGARPEDRVAELVADDLGDHDRDACALAPPIRLKAVEFKNDAAGDEENGKLEAEILDMLPSPAAPVLEVDEAELREDAAC